MAFLGGKCGPLPAGAGIRRDRKQDGRSGSARFLQGLLEDLVELLMFCQSSFQNAFHIIYVLQVDYQVDALVEGRHVVHGFETVA